MCETTEADKFARELIKIQYTQLGDAIKSTRERIHQITLTATLGLPASIIAAKALDIESINTFVAAIVCVMPIVLFAFFMFYIAERQAIKRYGLYIAEALDPIMKTNESLKLVGWHSAIRDKSPPFDSIIMKTRDYDDARTVGFVSIVLLYSIASITASAMTLSSLATKDSLECSSIFWVIFAALAIAEAVLMVFVFYIRAKLKEIINIAKAKMEII